MNWTHLENLLDSVVNEVNFSGVISISSRQKVVYQRAAGYADRSSRVLNTMNTRFGIASGTKFFTALAIGKLIDDGQLSLGTKLSDILCLPFDCYSSNITIQHLLTHTSGIPDYFDEELIDDFDNYKVAVPWSELEEPRDYLAVFPDAPMKFQPGERFSYSNGGYILLGVIIEELSEIKYREYVTEKILIPSEMHRSGYFAFNRLPESTAYGYIEEKQGWRTNIYDLPIIGASDGGAYTTVKDLSNMWDAFWGGTILSTGLVEFLTRPFRRVETEGEDLYYGHGIWIYHKEQICEEYITGADAGVSFKSGILRDREIEYSVLSNTSTGAWPILRIIHNFIRR
ncbi:MAG: serine hydrolase [Anaerolineae bacterium]|nr:serine hydrolase [Anaerolineae bacterium]